MRENFEDLYDYESPYSDKVWEEVNKSLSSSEDKQRLRFYMFSLMFFLVGASGGYLLMQSDHYFDNSPILEDFVLSDLSSSGIQEDASKNTANELEFLPQKSTILNHSSYSNTLVFESKVDLNDERSNAVGTDNRALSVTEVVSSSIKLNETQLNDAPPSSITVLDSERKIISMDQYIPKLQFGQNNHSVRPVLSATKSLPHRIQTTFNKANSSYSVLKDIESRLSQNHGAGCPTFGDAAYRLYTWSELGVLLPFSQFKSKGNTQEYEQARSNTERALLSPEIGVGLGVGFKDGYLVEAGVQYANWREKFSYTDPESIKYQTVIKIDTTITQIDTTITMDTFTELIEGSRVIVHNNIHESFSIPVLAGYNFDLSKNFSLGIKAGAIFNIHLQSKGKMLDHLMIARSIGEQSDQIQPYRTKLTTQFVFGGQLNYKFSPDVYAYVSHSFRYTPRSLTKENYALSQRYINPTINIGIKYFL